jgi:hypothetical protein
MSNLYKGPSIDASYQVSVHLAEGFQRRRLKCEKLTYDGRQVMTKAHIAFGDFHFCHSRVIGLDMTENMIVTLCRMIT